MLKNHRTSRVAPYLLGACFAAFGALHLAFPAGVGTTLGQWTSAWPALRWAHPAMLLALGSALVCPRSRLPALYAAVGMMAAFTGLLAVGLWHPAPRGCGCVPDVYPAVTAVLNSTVAGLVRNVVLLGLALSAIWDSGAADAGSPQQ